MYTLAEWDFLLVRLWVRALSRVVEATASLLSSTTWTQDWIAVERIWLIPRLTEWKESERETVKKWARDLFVLVFKYKKEKGRDFSDDGIFSDTAACLFFNRYFKLTFKNN